MEQFAKFSVEELRHAFLQAGSPPQPAGMQTSFTSTPAFGSTAQPTGGFGTFGTS